MADRSGATPSRKRGCKPLKDQLEQLKKAVRLASPGVSKSAEKECQAMEVEVSKPIISQQKGLGDKIPLSLVLKTEGEVYGQMHEALRASIEALTALEVIKQRVMQGGPEEENEDRATSSEEDDEEDEDGGAEPQPSTSLILRKRSVKRDQAQRQPIFKSSKGKGKLRKSRRVSFEQGAPDPGLSLPLIAGPKNEPVYRAYKVRDLEALVKQLPPITKGEHWEGEELALGDFRTLAGRCMLGGGLADVEQIAQTTRYANDLKYHEVQSDLADAVREKDPTPNFGVIPKIIWDPKKKPRECLAKAKEQWLLETGIHPGKEGESRAWFRSAVLAGLPNQVAVDLEKNPDFAVADSVQWERHVTHRLQQEQDLTNKQKKELDEAQAQLLRLQLGEAREKYNAKKKEPKELNKTIMVARPQPDPVPDWPDQDPGLYPDDRWPANAPRQRQPVGNWGTGGPQRGRGGSVRGGQRARNPGNPGRVSWTACLRCGAEGHWARDCPEPPQNYQGRGYQSQARGGPRQRAAYRGAHQAPNPNAAPAPQYPVADWGWEGEQY
ncbi:uncharacterized protein LOC143414755 [Maylandia zebra]|uniref:uncharacterized protein LOC143414755 n=1 Tax=Maylandia zebra TaxID=106582 RepID=UPI00403D10A7